ncbi:MAG: enoyl-CoA hydratase/isomerase family protein [Syntrophobacteraceae bacterium]
MSEDFKTLKLAKDGKICWLYLNTPDILNILTDQRMDELDVAVDQLIADDSVRVIIIHGVGKAFCAGVDISWFMKTPALEIYKKVRQYQHTLLKLEKSDKISIASIRGMCLGGGADMIIACDIRIATPSAVLGHPEINFGIFPAGGGSERLQRVIGDGAAREIILTGRNVGAEEALRLGWVNRIVNEDELEAQALVLAQELALKPPIAAITARRAMINGYGKDVETAMAIEINEFFDAVDSEDAQRGFEAFINEKKILYKGKWR